MSARLLVVSIAIFLVACSGSSPGRADLENPLLPVERTDAEYVSSRIDRFVEAANRVWTIDGTFCVAGEGGQAPLSLSIEAFDYQFGDFSEDTQDYFEQYEPEQGCLAMPSAYSALLAQERDLEWRRSNDPTFRESRNVMLFAARYEQLRDYAQRIRSPVGYFSLLNPEQELPLIVANSTILRGEETPDVDEFAFILDYLRPTISAFEDVLRTWPRSENAPIFSGNALIRIQLSDRFLDAHANRRDGYREIFITPALLRSFFAMCAIPIHRIVELDRDEEQCRRLTPAWGLSEAQIQNYAYEFCGPSIGTSTGIDPFYCIQRVKDRVCRRDMTAGYRASFLRQGVECVQEQAAFWIGHELSHVFLRHNASTRETEAQADYCAIKMIDAAQIGFSGEQSFRRGLFPFIGRYPELFLDDVSSREDVAWRIALIENRDSPANTHNCDRRSAEE